MSTPAPEPAAAVIRLHRADSDEALVASLRAGEPGAGRALFDAYGAYVRRVLMRVLGPDPEIGDLTQDVFVVALESLPKLENARALRGWLAQIAVFQARHCLRGRKQWSILRFFGPEDMPAGRARDPDFEASEALRTAYRCLASLGADEQIAFTLRFIEGMDLAEVAGTCGVSLATIKRRLARAEARFVELARDEPSLAEWLAPSGEGPRKTDLEGAS
jgi:RNA polymerase sigma-70 factor (ECF subfamily)